MVCSISVELYDGGGGHWEWPPGVALIPLRFSAAAFAAAASAKKGNW